MHQRNCHPNFINIHKSQKFGMKQHYNDDDDDDDDDDIHVPRFQKSQVW